MEVGVTEGKGNWQSRDQGWDPLLKRFIQSDPCMVKKRETSCAYLLQPFTALWIPTYLYYSCLTKMPLFVRVPLSAWHFGCWPWHTPLLQSCLKPCWLLGYFSIKCSQNPAILLQILLANLYQRNIITRASHSLFQRPSQFSCSLSNSGFFPEDLQSFCNSCQWKKKKSSILTHPLVKGLQGAVAYQWSERI